MPHSDLLPSLLYKINENQLALEASIMELSNWVEARGSADVAENVRGAVQLPATKVTTTAGATLS